MFNGLKSASVEIQVAKEQGFDLEDLKEKTLCTFFLR